jgi:2-(1,2-epoxy-1,2-dihydrophenyl)acetyl-CoA isomerase
MRDSGSTPLERHEFIRHEFGGLIKQIVAMDKPVIAAINGYAMGVGLFTALSCDMIIASDQAKFGTDYIHLGLTPLGVSYLLAKILGYCRAYELCALSDVFDARRAEALGVVNCVVPHERPLDETRKIAGRLADGPPRGLGFIKQLLRRAVHPDLEEHQLLGEAVQPLRCWIRNSRERYDARTIGCLVPAASQKQNKAFAPISLIANGGAMPEPTFTVRTKESKRHLRCSRARA